MSKTDLLSSLTADRLDEDAARHRRTARGYRDWLRTNASEQVTRDAEFYERSAAICEALAKAERWMIRCRPETGGFAPEDDDMEPEHGWVGPCVAGYRGRTFPTLLAALGSVGQQEKHDANDNEV